MANQNYDQLAELVAQGKLLWTLDRILALLAEGVVFTASDTKLSALGASVPARFRVPISGRMMAGRSALGAAVVYEDVPPGVAYQVLVVQDDERGDFNLLAYIDVDSQGLDLSVDNPGTLIVRPVALDPPTGPPTTGVWLTF